MRVLVVNAGSSSVKLSVLGDEGGLESASELGPPGSGLRDELDAFLAGSGRLDVAGHRVVHGGGRFAGPVLVDASVRRELDELTELAPLHNPPALAAIDAVRARMPDLPNVACFDTSFHLGLPAAASHYALPAAWVDRWQIRRYGFHGLSCQWATTRAGELTGHEPSDLRLVVCHLGSGASVTAVAGGRSVDTTMGFTPVEGLVMGTRSGDVDPGLLVWMLRRGLSLDELDRGLEHEAGLLGLMGGETSDMREVETRRRRGDKTAAAALDVYLHRLRAKIAAVAAAMGGLDVLLFTGGVGEHSSAVRAETCGGLGWMGVGIDAVANAAVGADDAEITGAGAAVRTLVVHAREDLVIAAGCREVLGRRSRTPASDHGDGNGGDKVRPPPPGAPP